MAAAAAQVRLGEALSFSESMDGLELAQDAEPTVETISGDDEEPTEGVLLAQLIQLLSTRPQHSLLLSDLGALVPSAVRHRVKDNGGLRSWLQQNSSLFIISGEPGKEFVSLASGSDEKKALEAASTNPAATTTTLPVPAPFDEEVDGPSSLQLRGLPYRATAQDVRAFLGQHEALLADGGADVAVHLLHNRDGRPSGFARVRLISPEAAAQCRDDLHLKSMEDRYVEVFVYSERPGKGRQRQRAAEEAALATAGVAVAAPANGSGLATGASVGNAEGPRSLCLAEAAGVTREQVVRECRQEMVRQPKRRMLLSMLGVALSPGARAYLKQMDQGLKHFLRLFPNEFVVEGGKGCEYVVYTPLQLSEALDFDDARLPSVAAPSASEAQQRREALLAEASIPPSSPCPTRTEDVRISTGVGRDIMATPSDWGTPGFTPPVPQQQQQWQGQAPWLPPWPAMPGMTQPDAGGIAQGNVAAGAAVAACPDASGAAWANTSAWAMPQLWTGWPPAMPSWPSAAPGADAGAPPPLPLSLFPGAFPTECGTQPATDQTIVGTCAAPAGVPTPPTTAPSSAANSLGNTPPSVGKGGPAATLRLRGLPYQATEQDVFNFFGQHDVVDRVSEDPKAVNLLCRGNGRPSGQALVQMRGRADAELAREVLHGKWMGSRYIEVFLHGEDGQLEGLGNNGGGTADRPPSAGSSDEERHRRREAAQQAEAQAKAQANAAAMAVAAQPQPQGANGWAVPGQTRMQAPLSQAQLWQMSMMAMAGQAGGPPPPIAPAGAQQSSGSVGGLVQGVGSTDESSWEALFNFLGREGMAAMAAGMGGMPVTGAAPVGGG